MGDKIGIEEWIKNTHREGDQSLVGVDPDALARLIQAAEMGLRFAECELSRQKSDFPEDAHYGRIHRWTKEEVCFIRNALGI